MATTTTTKTTIPKATNGAGVKKAAPKGGRVGKKNNARTAMAKMQAYFKAHRDEYKDLSFKEQQQELGKKWKASPENPKNNV
ncbi:hypothetical protein CC77DRAFT_1057558 [Alternaria alternata]|uniref:HMG box domain-containing protein n=2 Tax=Alternaria sect. Alternaria TaxID=2499237 RepID=A0A177DX69_ALTAL|nr:hypothetical protein CC77DRAFT_1057558 [Alternaria alternata]XP_028511941.1 hypothetical protein AA0111_g168 [Alternaria arborescens]RII06067.1 hypothetical protein CUC08_Gglean009282 [Alternaria sp. MG1]OAG24335.1 hypothetical protein CC77DRAFT_1057558 [Alternaria alternata]OWY44181.1 hypothetical protein AALT_g5903 [Alternaria alternata]RYN32966.1 hypothetical protein AA0112_g5857 [Alternaria arborescens]RYO43040.1 hypothetical protein AA0111_g168 [Alternaria arborescens]